MPAGTLVDHLFRHSAGQMVAMLTRVLGPARLDLAEEVVQEAMIRALETWPYRGVPADPRGWLFRVARNRALDVLRRDAVFTDKIALLSPRPDSHGPAHGVMQDDGLAMVFMCCHASLPRESQVALTLKTVGGFSVAEIAAAFLAERATIAQRLVRAKRVLIDEGVRFELPCAKEMAARLDVVLEVLYLLFNEGYAAHGGELLVRAELCGEAIRLTRLLATHPQVTRPEVHALLALMLLQASRLPARQDDSGDLLLIAEQDRVRWDRALIGDGMRQLDLSAVGDAITPYHIQAAIAAAHASARSHADTDWPNILGLYDQLLALTHSPVVQLNRAIALSKVHGPESGIRELERLLPDRALKRYFLLPAALAGLWLEAGRLDEAASWYRRGLELPCNAAERRFMIRRLAACGSV